jgi:polysaccharide export outer membrane protein
MKTFERKSWRAAAALSIVLVVVAGCGPKTDNSQVHLSPPVENTTIGEGDIFSMQIVGEKDLPQEYQVAADGTVDVPYIHRVRVEGLEPQQIVTLIRRRMIQEKILNDPSIVLQVRAYNSKKITVLGQVQKPGSMPFAQGLSLIQAISMAGGFNAIAKRDQVNLTRKTKSGSETVVLSVDSIIEGSSPDIPLQAGDQIYVHERVF